ncbi:methylated-DNA--[protein]-cysteine S-methyltransferase [Kordiimonas pumila]|uniref:Methylated-DNA--[protein]-cysteine S-methyltransferase n=1 Tax=Kordiimonas pumila TaxID=2161677 RepID=A0ABV7D720_9PROT|nr:methylated-DNA--[protein]-cysteine S-methyltransferase [Kordiimonas pumila]
MHNTYIYTEYHSPVGALTLLTKESIILICEFSDKPERITKQIDRFYTAVQITHGALPEPILTAFQQYFSGNLGALNTLVSEPEGTVFEKTVWKTLREIPVGTTTSYGMLAKKLQSGARAIGRANGRNPVCLIHPCHRVIGADGSLTGYAGGIERKEWLLAHENAL